MPLRAGLLRHQITVQTPTDVTDATGAVSSTWETLVTAWAAIWPVTAKEQVAAGQLITTLSHRIRMRYYDGVTSKCRVKFGNRYFDIKAVINAEERNEMLDLLCTEEVD